MHRSKSRSTTASCAPNSASPRQKCWPRMPTAPVTTAVLPVNSNKLLYADFTEKHFPVLDAGHAARDQHLHNFEGPVRRDSRLARTNGFRELPEHTTKHRKVVSYVECCGALSAKEFHVKRPSAIAQSVD